MQFVLEATLISLQFIIVPRQFSKVGEVAMYIPNPHKSPSLCLTYSLVPCRVETFVPEYNRVPNAGTVIPLAAVMVPLKQVNNTALNCCCYYGGRKRPETELEQKCLIPQLIGDIYVSQLLAPESRMSLQENRPFSIRKTCRSQESRCQTLHDDT